MHRREWPGDEATQEWHGSLSEDCYTKCDSSLRKSRPVGHARLDLRSKVREVKFLLFS